MSKSLNDRGKNADKANALTNAAAEEFVGYLKAGDRPYTTAIENNMVLLTFASDKGSRVFRMPIVGITLFS